MRLWEGPARWAGVAIAVMAVGTAALWKFGLTGPGRTSPIFEATPFLDMWVRWDAGWYEQIAARGYTFSPTAQSAAAYFPVYPLLMKAVMLPGTNVFLAGMIVTWLAGAAAAFVFSRWARPDVAGLSTWLLLLWPFAFFLYGAVYSDATFLLLTVSAFLLLERNRLFWAIVVGAAAAATRPIAPAVVIGMLAVHLARTPRPWSVKDFAPLLTALGPIAFMAFLWVQFGDPFAFLTTQAGWHQISGAGSWLKLDALSTYKPIDLFLPAFHGALAMFVLFLGFRMRKTLGWGYAVYVAVAMGIPLITSRDFIGLGRYAIAAFPALVQLAIELQPRPRARVAWLVVSALLLVWMTVRFANGRYVS